MASVRTLLKFSCLDFLTVLGVHMHVNAVNDVVDGVCMRENMGDGLKNALLDFSISFSLTLTSSAMFERC